MSRLEDIKKEIREKGHFVCETQIDWIARNIARSEKMEQLDKNLVGIYKDMLGKKSS